MIGFQGPDDGCHKAHSGVCPESKACAFVREGVEIFDGVGQSAGGSGHGDAAVTLGFHGDNTARLEQTGHEEDVGAGNDFFG